SEQDARSRRGPGAQHDAPRSNDVHAPVRLHLQAGDAAAGQQDAPGQRIGANAQVGAPANRRCEVAARRAHADTVDEIHRVRTGARGRRVVRIATTRKPEHRAGLEKGRLPGRELVGTMAADGNGTLLRVPFTSYVEIVFEAPESRKASGPVPIAQTERSPL